MHTYASVSHNVELDMCHLLFGECNHCSERGGVGYIFSSICAYVCVYCSIELKSGSVELGQNHLEPISGLFTQSNRTLPF